jgi:dTDP-4-dehydrorhamnose reductase
MPSRNDTLPASRSPQRLVILGANGLLGSSIFRHLTGDPQLRVWRLDRNQLNLADPLLVDETLAALDFDWLINCAAYTAVDDCENQSGHAYLINGHAAGQVARICSAKGARMIHFSTDYVFDGTKGAPYTEEEPVNPISIYGRSKLIGERQVLAADAKHVAIRLSWLFGPGRPGFPEWVIRQATSGQVRVVNDKIGCPTYSEDVAVWLRKLISLPRLAGGVINVCNPSATTWFEYAKEILRLTGSEIQPEPISMKDLPGLQAARPDNSALDPTLFETLTGLRCRSWKEALADHLAVKAPAA